MCYIMLWQSREQVSTAWCNYSPNVKTGDKKCKWIHHDWILHLHVHKQLMQHKISDFISLLLSSKNLIKQHKAAFHKYWIDDYYISQTEIMIFFIFVYVMFVFFFFLLLLAGLPVRVKVAAKRLPAVVVAFVKSLACLQTPLGHCHAEGRLEHESLREEKDM